ncbi:MAG: hypothetical protein KA439_10505, partial [Rhizobacter sp.]|nr:hypothetical protein [Rhizobacter sp.]MBP6270558.1 hypothetical protein [Rhizobacter sp.]
MRSDNPPNTPSGRPPATVLVSLTLMALALHGCLLDAVPVEAAELSSPVARTAPAVQVRSLVSPPIEPGAEPALQP